MDVFNSMSREEIVIFTAIIGVGAGIIVSFTAAALVMCYRIRVRRHQERMRRQRRNAPQATPGRESRVSMNRHILIKNPALLSQEHSYPENRDSVVVVVSSPPNVRSDDTI